MTPPIAAGISMTAGKDQYVQHRELHLARFDFFAQVLGRPPHHQARDEHRQHRHHDDPVNPEPTPPKITSPSCMLISGTSPPSGV